MSAVSVLWKRLYADWWTLDRHGVESRKVETVLFSQISWIEVVNLTLV